MKLGSDIDLDFGKDTFWSFFRQSKIAQNLHFDKT